MLVVEAPVSCLRASTHLSDVSSPTPTLTSHCSWAALTELVATAMGRAEEPPQPLAAPEPLPAKENPQSPVTVMHTLRSAASLRQPSTNQHARTMRVEAAQIMRDAYCDLVRDESTQWRFSDIDERAARVTARYDDTIVRSPEQDALGVVACAVGVMRYVVSDSLLLAHNLDRSVRYHMACILFAVYKVKTEDSWSSGRSMTMHVLERFLHPHEMDVSWRNSQHACARYQRIAWAAEADLVINHPFAVLVDYGVHGHFEVALAQLLEHGARPELADKQGNTSLVLALSNKHAAVAEMLIPTIAAARALDTQNDNCKTALMLVSVNGNAVRYTLYDVESMHHKY